MSKHESLSKMRERVSEACCLSSLWLKRSRKHVTIDLIAVEPSARGKGMGQAAMLEIVAWADATGCNLSLVPSAQYGSDADRLTRWYASFGFHKISDGSSMLRYARVA